MRYRHLRVIAFAAALYLPALAAPAAAAQKHAEPQQQDLRELFVTVETQLKQNNDQPFLTHLAQLKNYPLMPYLEWLELSNRLTSLTQKDIDRYISTYPNTPQADKIQRQWLDFLARFNRWQDYLAAYKRGTVRQARYQCLQGRAFYHLGSSQKAWTQASRLWLTGKSQNKACDPLFSAWKKAGRLTQTLAFKRFWLAVDQGNLQLARYIDRAIEKPSLKAATRLFWRIHNNPGLLTGKSGLDNRRAKHRIVFLHGIRQLARKDIRQASDLWLKTRDNAPFTLGQVAQLDRWLAIRLAKRFDSQADDYIARLDPLFSYPQVTEWRIRLALTRQDWSAVAALIARLPKEVADKSRWRYWQGVATLYQVRDQSRDQVPETANTAFSALSQERDFYGFLVADMSNRPVSLNQAKPTIQPQPLQRLLGEFKGLPRIREWLYHGRYYQAQSELNQLKPRLVAGQRKLLAYLARQWGWHYQAIMTAASEALWNDLELRFPTPQAELFSKFARQRELDSAWVMAIARQESAFNPRARSHAGARGMMQLMPATARQAARQNQIRYKKTTDLYQPGVNIALGTAHLAGLVEQFENNRVFATAAYNAGATRVNRWLKKRGHLPLDIWIETIPYDETRQYVQNVLAFRVIYKTLSDSPVRLLSSREAAMLSLGSLNRKSLSLSKPTPP